jgi:hypothetical protein
MCINKKVFLKLCELYPATGESLRLRSLERRKFFLEHMEKLDIGSPLKAMNRGINSKINRILHNIGGMLLSPDFRMNSIINSERSIEDDLE